MIFFFSYLVGLGLNVRSFGKVMRTTDEEEVTAAARAGALSASEGDSGAVSPLATAHSLRYLSTLTFLCSLIHTLTAQVAITGLHTSWNLSSFRWEV